MAQPIRKARAARSESPRSAPKVTPKAASPAALAPSRRAPRICVLDIETAPLQSYHWGLWDQNIGLEMICVEWTILSFSAKWLGEKGITYRDTSGGGPGKVREDRPLLRELWNILDKADIVVAQNGKSFDVKKINARLLMGGFRPYSPIKIVDTLIIAKNTFSFTSNKLQWMSKHLTDTPKDAHKEFPGFELWAECMKDNPRAWAEMRKYNCLDTLSTEKLYLKMLPWIVGHPNVAAYSSTEEVSCPKCGGQDLQMRGRSFTQSGEYHRYQCKGCGGWARSRYTLNSTETRRALLSN